MKTTYLYSATWPLLCAMIIMISCKPQVNIASQEKEEINPASQLAENVGAQIGDYMTGILEDSKGNMWFARDGYGATKYDGETFTHFTKKDGLASNNVCDIQEDKLGNIWFASRITEKDNPDVDKRLGPGGLVKYDGKDFVDFPDVEGLSKSDVFQIYRDSKDNLWISTTSNGVYKYDGKQFTNYRKNHPDSENAFPKSVMSILEGSKGNIWLGCAGGLFRITSDGVLNVTTNGPWS